MVTRAGRRRLAGSAALAILLSGRPVHGAAGDDPGAVVADARGILAGAASSEGTSMFVWGLTAVVAGGYAAATFSGHVHGPDFLRYLSIAGVAGGLTGLSAAAWEQRRLHGLIHRVDEDLGRPAGAEPILQPMTAAMVGTALRRMDRELHRSSEGALRAGCVVPVLLSGIGLYGILLDEPAGQQLAGVTLGGAMVIGVPSMLTYWGLNDRLEHLDALLQRWNATIETGISGGAIAR